MRIQTKSCLVCGRFFPKPITESQKSWDTRHKYCTKVCANNAPRSEETRHKMRLRKLGKPTWNKGKPWSRAIRKKMSEARQGIKLSEETKKKMSDTRRGRKLSLQWRENISLAQRGRRGNNWQGGKTKRHNKLRHCSKYRVWREMVFERDNYTCQFCDKHGGKLNADHIKPFSMYKELRYDVSNGRTLCASCHHKTDTFGGRIRVSVTKSGSKNTNAA